MEKLLELLGFLGRRRSLLLQVSSNIEIAKQDQQREHVENHRPSHPQEECVLWTTDIHDI